MPTPKYLTCPCGYPLSEQTTVKTGEHVYRCGKCGYQRRG